MGSARFPTRGFPTAAGIMLLACGWAAGVPLDYVAQKEDTPVVHVAQGDLVGVFQTSSGGAKFMAFYGIPYAKPPTGDLRFKAPQPADKWEGVFAARKEGNMCPQPRKPAVPSVIQKRMFGVVPKVPESIKALVKLPNVPRIAAKFMTGMEEDCLFLNVYTPLESLPPAQLLPVLVFFHGGGFLIGSSDSFMYGPDHLMNRGIVLVTLNYRLGPLGFLATGTADAPGNAGLKDQRLALRWVRDNIKSLGGDPDKVTIYGESAGSYSAHMHVLSPGSKGLFRAGILASSMSPNAYGFQTNHATLSARLAEALGADAVTAKDAAKRVQFLQGVPVAALIDKMTDVVRDEDLQTLGLACPWAVVAEPADTEDAFLTRSPNDVLREGDFVRVPLMLGLTANEGAITAPMLGDAVLAAMATNLTRLLPTRLYDKLDAGQRPDMAKRVVDEYLKGKAFARDALPEIVELFGDTALAHGIHLGARWHAKHATAEAPVFVYLFSLDAFGAVSYMVGISKDLRGPAHADDLGYVFKMHILDGLEVPEEARFKKGIAWMTELIANFVKDGNPTPANRSADLAAEWPSVSPGREQHLDIGDDLLVKEGLPLRERMAFWDKLCKEVAQDPLCDV